ncbi:MAG TPA: aminodeoxychorismate lyase [Nevskiales bacterium]|nr:aminodeoxychorismate lyase [Nevskiales bacterium]
MNGLLRVRVNGVENGALPATDRGLQYGDGVFRTMRVEAGTPQEWSRQYAHLCADAGRLGLAAPPQLEDQVRQFCAGVRYAVLKIILTRGAAGRGYAAAGGEGSVILLLYAPPAHPPSHWRDGVRVRWCDTRLAPNPRLAGIKHLNRLEQVLARAEWSDLAIAEGLMRDADGRVIEGVASNLFIVRGGELLTPDLARCGIAGVAREMILEAAPAYTSAVHIRDLTPDELLAADECFVCNSVVGIWPVSTLDERRWPVGPVTRRLQALFGDAWPPAA